MRDDLRVEDAQAGWAVQSGGRGCFGTPVCCHVLLLTRDFVPQHIKLN